MTKAKLLAHFYYIYNNCEELAAVNEKHFVGNHWLRLHEEEDRLTRGAPGNWLQEVYYDKDFKCVVVSITNPDGETNYYH